MRGIRRTLPIEADAQEANYGRAAGPRHRRPAYVLHPSRDQNSRIVGATTTVSLQSRFGFRLSPDTRSPAGITPMP